MMKKIRKIPKFIGLLAVAAPPKWTDITGLRASRYTDIIAVVAGVIEWLLGFAGALAVFAIIYSGIMYMTAGGDAEKALKARKNLLWAVFGVIIIFLSFAIIRSIGTIFTNPL